MKKYFYEVNYHYTDSGNDNHYFLIGYFSSCKKAKAAIEELQHKSGFKDFSGTFDVEKFAVNFDENPIKKEGLVLYELSHEYLDSDGYDNFIIFGLYSTLEEAQKAKLEKSRQQPYINLPDGFLIDECKVDLCGWTDGFSLY